ncbi:MAG: enoyl-CoA hydratase-related protein [Planctomycetota bacterium]
MSMQQADGTVRVRRAHDDRVVVLTLDAPKANVLDANMVAGLVAALDQEVSPATRLLVFEGAGQHFSFGASVEEHRPDQVASLLEGFHGLFRKLAQLAVPTCAVVRGQCLGGGLELASWCTWIAATPDARLGQPEIKLAMFPPMASLLLPWRVGGAAGLDLCVSGRSVTADEARAMGLVNVVTDEPEAWWQGLVIDHLAKTSAMALRHAERAARSTLLRQIDEELPRLERRFIDELMQTHDANEGIEAFVARRAPVYLDR